MRKKILILAGTHFQIPLIKYAKEAGHFVITCDNKPENPGHRLADKSYNVSTTDLEGILQVGQNERIDAILAFASDIAAPSAAYVAEKLNLIGNSFNTNKILTDKGLFRGFLTEIGFPVPEYKVIKTRTEAIEYCKTFNDWVYIKPVDSSGSKGITRLWSNSDIQKAYNYAMIYSREKEIIIEKTIKNKGPHIHGEAFFEDGELKFMQLGDQYFSMVDDCAPLSTTFPSLFHLDIMNEVK